MSKRKLTVGSLRGVPQGRVRPPTFGGQPVFGGAPIPPPSKRGKGCCRKGCLGCPWAEAQRRALSRSDPGAGALVPPQPVPGP